MTSKIEDICSKLTINKTTKCEGSYTKKSSAKCIAKFKQIHQPSSQNWAEYIMVSSGGKFNQPYTKV